MINVTAELQPNASLGGANEALASQLAQVHFPSGYRWELAGAIAPSKSRFPACSAC